MHWHVNKFIGGCSTLCASYSPKPDEITLYKSYNSNEENLVWIETSYHFYAYKILRDLPRFIEHAMYMQSYLFIVLNITT